MASPSTPSQELGKRNESSQQLLEIKTNPSSSDTDEDVRIPEIAGARHKPSMKLNKEKLRRGRPKKSVGESSEKCTEPVAKRKCMDPDQKQSSVASSTASSSQQSQESIPGNQLQLMPPNMCSICTENSKDGPRDVLQAAESSGSTRPMQGAQPSFEYDPDEETIAKCECACDCACSLDVDLSKLVESVEEITPESLPEVIITRCETNTVMIIIHIHCCRNG